MNKNFIYGVLISSLFYLGCAVTFPYKHYGLDAQSYEGKLLGPKPTQDIDLKICKPDEQVSGKCIVMLGDDFHKMKADFKNLVEQLKACQSGR